MRGVGVTNAGKSYPWPCPPGSSQPATWTGNGFFIDGQITSVLTYEVGKSGWTDDLTTFHEENAGATHFIDLASRKHALVQVTRYASVKPGVVLEVGCSSGFMLRLLRQQLPHWLVMGSDYVRGPLEQLASDIPEIPLLHFDLLKCPLQTETVDAVVLLNVLEHIGDDTAAIDQIYRILKPGGVAIIEVPAGPGIYDVYDQLLLHHRRYSAGALRNLATKAGFRIVNQSHLGFFIYPGFWLVKQHNKRFLSGEDAVRHQVVAQNIRSTGGNPILRALMSLELALGRRLSYPFGIRCVATCIKSS